MSNLFALLCENHNRAVLVTMKSRDVYDLKGCNRNRRGGGGGGGRRSVGTIADGGRSRLLNCNIAI